MTSNDGLHAGPAIRRCRQYLTGDAFKQSTPPCVYCSGSPAVPVKGARRGRTQQGILGVPGHSLSAWSASACER